MCVGACAHVASKASEGVCGGQAGGWQYPLQSLWSLAGQPAPLCSSRKGKCYVQSSLRPRASPQLEGCLRLAQVGWCLWSYEQCPWYCHPWLCDWCRTTRKPRGVKGMKEAFFSSSCKGQTCMVHTACPWVPRENKCTSDNSSALGRLQKDSFIPLGLRNKCEPKSCISLGGTSLFHSPKPQEAQADTSSSSNCRILGPGHQEGVNSPRQQPTVGKVWS